MPGRRVEKVAGIGIIAAGARKLWSGLRRLRLLRRRKKLIGWAVTARRAGIKRRAGKLRRFGRGARRAAIWGTVGYGMGRTAKPRREYEGVKPKARRVKMDFSQSNEYPPSKQVRGAHYISCAKCGGTLKIRKGSQPATYLGRKGWKFWGPRGKKKVICPKCIRKWAVRDKEREGIETVMECVKCSTRSNTTKKVCPECGERMKLVPITNKRVEIEGNTKGKRMEVKKEMTLQEAVRERERTRELSGITQSATYQALQKKSEASKVATRDVLRTNQAVLKQIGKSRVEPIGSVESEDVSVKTAEDGGAVVTHSQTVKGKGGGSDYKTKTYVAPSVEAAGKKVVALLGKVASLKARARELRKRQKAGVTTPGRGQRGE